MAHDHGVLPDFVISELMDHGYIEGIDPSFINPASLDMPLADEAYRLEAIFQLKPGQHVRMALNDVGALRHNLANPLEVGVPYLIRIAGSWSLPQSVYGYANPKSSTGRLNLFARLVADGIGMYDHLSKGWSDELWLLVRADSFPVLLHPGIAVSQMRFFSGKAFVDDLHLEFAVKKHGLLYSPEGRKIKKSDIPMHGDSVLLGLAVGEEFGYECRPSHRPLDLSKVGEYDPLDYFQPITARGGSFLLRKNSFYILSTLERVKVNADMSAELRAIDIRLGEFRSHAARFIDPGWGCDAGGKGNGSSITLEVIPYEDMLVREGQTIARIRFEHMQEAPRKPYTVANSNYVGQRGPKLSKHFR